MNKLIRHTIISLSVIWAIPSSAVTYTTPNGIWDIYSSTTVTITAGTATQKDQIGPTMSQAFYFDNLTYKNYDWSGIPGTWQQGAANAVTTRLQISKIPTSTNNPAYLNRLVNDFSSYISKTSGTTPQISGISLQSYTDDAILDSTGLVLKGTTTGLATITYKDPKTRLATTAKLNLNGSYQGIRASAPSACCTSTDPTVNLALSTKFLGKNAQLTNVVSTATGLQYKVIQKANGDTRKPKATDTVQVSYRGYLPSGQVFDANAGISFPLNRVISGWTEGLQLMSVGDYYRFYIPPNLAYGSQSAGSYIKPNSALIFDVILESIQ